MGLHPQIMDGYQPLASKPGIRHPGLCREGSRQMPVAFATERSQDCLTFARPQCQEMADLGYHAEISLCKVKCELTDL